MVLELVFIENNKTYSHKSNTFVFYPFESAAQRFCTDNPRQQNLLLVRRKTGVEGTHIYRNRRQAVSDTGRNNSSR